MTRRREVPAARTTCSNSRPQNRTTATQKREAAVGPTGHVTTEQDGSRRPGRQDAEHSVARSGLPAQDPEHRDANPSCTCRAPHSHSKSRNQGRRPGRAVPSGICRLRENAAQLKAAQDGRRTAAVSNGAPRCAKGERQRILLHSPTTCAVAPLRACLSRTLAGVPSLDAQGALDAPPGEQAAGLGPQGGGLIIGGWVQLPSRSRGPGHRGNRLRVMGPVSPALLDCSSLRHEVSRRSRGEPLDATRRNG